MLMLKAIETAARLPYLGLARAIADILKAKARGEAFAPERSHVPLPGGGTLLLMPASDPRLAIVTLVTAHPDNVSRGLPVISDAVQDDAFVAAVGAFTPNTVELPASLMRRGIVHVDTAEGAKSEADDVLLAGLAPGRVHPLELALNRTPPDRGPVIFKSVGGAIFDLAAARLALAEEFSA